MTNTLVGDVYQKIIEEVVTASQNDFEESGVGTTTLTELQQEWQAKLSQRGVAQMPWDPKPQPPPQQQPAQTQAPPSSMPSASPNGMPPSSYQSYDNSQTTGSNGASRIKQEPGTEQQYHGLPTSYPSNPGGGLARAQQLVQEQYGSAGAASINAMQQRGGLALPGQQQKSPGIQLPGGSPQQSGQPNFQQQQAAAMAQRQQQQLAQQQANPRIKVENDSPQMQQGQFQQQRPQTNYSQTDGADEGMDEWRAMLAERRALHAQQGEHADRMMRDQVMQLAEGLQSGLMVPLSEQPSKKIKKRRAAAARSTQTTASSSSAPSIPQLDGDADEEDEKPDLKDEDDENAINSDLDDSDDDGAGAMGDDDDDMGDSILCTYDKVQRVKNKWKCTLKDGVMSVNGKEWVFHKGQGEFEW
ncbi:transcription initiation factor IIA large subunit-like [Lecanosticta acicola]|uniref:Transcription initiation factor IIA large subunit-like n=1 Tax=Lecanosticta acicola TaxID=111012 RepID=A0AAI8Z4X3_9PEZI|nr:transcription initiation factor IIA large subunit-like [Lecanosticta acicola]